eukprot:m.97562 g.97562  ORF g.97562 m.97562 type:complete len:310 (-) comp15227_c3_seq1:441-1370(-)
MLRLWLICIRRCRISLPRLFATATTCRCMPCGLRSGGRPCLPSRWPSLPTRRRPCGSRGSPSSALSPRRCSCTPAAGPLRSASKSSLTPFPKGARSSSLVTVSTATRRTWCKNTATLSTCTSSAACLVATTSAWHTPPPTSLSPRHALRRSATRSLRAGAPARPWRCSPRRATSSFARRASTAFSSTMTTSTRPAHASPRFQTAGCGRPTSCQSFSARASGFAAPTFTRTLAASCSCPPSKRATAARPPLSSRWCGWALASVPCSPGPLSASSTASVTWSSTRFRKSTSLPSCPPSAGALEKVGLVWHG